MKAEQFQEWVDNFYGRRGWLELDIFMRIGFLSEETGEVARAIRALEIGRDRPDEEAQSSEVNKQALVEELGDLMGNIAVIANKYDIELADVFSEHRRKLEQRFN
ncbi:MazG nucleotide pyrophosphohydrolase domain-containing protein [Geomicrobium sediminis]|uniref:NTP pyrophosphatase (Non-canonical NTP hydrolase) n=1 Tax=Geomicrobium sediminis TaxID=1347788 RepID=A0ABS2PHY6_9BACL|nr:MazG-like family protein [Geomicrobium sediminis]MBM7634892.1 NTP pyrophosphatase (non-canonical NTP hydrolase) [Geomicrobium sediminis]